MEDAKKDEGSKQEKKEDWIPAFAGMTESREW